MYLIDIFFLTYTTNMKNKYDYKIEQHYMTCSIKRILRMFLSLLTQILSIYFRKLVNNHTFFQHPDLIRVLRIHENVMAVMINTLGRRSQAQSDAAAQPQTAGEGETVPKKVTSEIKLSNL